MFTQTIYRVALATILSLALPSCLPEKKSAQGGKGGADDTLYVLADPGIVRPVGWTCVRTTELVGKDHPATLKTGPQTMNGTQSTRTFTQTVLQSLGIDRRRLTVQRDMQTTAFAFEGGPKEKNTKKGPLIRQFVIMDRVDGRWVGRLESGQTPTAEQRKEIADHAKELSEQGAFIEPAQARIGDEWEIDASRLGWDDTATGVVRVRFDRVEEHRGESCAVLTGSVDLESEVVEAGQAGGFTMKATFTTYRSLEQFVDLDIEVEGTTSVEVSPQLGLTVKSGGPVRFVEHAEISEPVPRVSQR